jgi:hypothetical protein
MGGVLVYHDLGSGTEHNCSAGSPQCVGYLAKPQK